MELWVRSQDKKTLLKCDNITITIDSEDGKNIKGYKVVGYEDLGRYETEERAFEILDEIQNKINLINLGHDFGSPMIDLKNPTYIYQMPEK